MASILTKILKKEIPGKILHEDEICAAILDINPQAPKHILIYPKKEIVSTDTATPEDKAILGHCLLVAAEVARQQGISERGYRLVINTGEDGAQTIPHLHIHLLGGRPMDWPPG
ncbi:MAG: histidine triad nucleotide-binding protein [Bdellovibrionales bacterium]|nr:histidine triad nucleotide-binding protein [Bdellovibrionales bacterium]